jgi:hypothetical protein
MELMISVILVYNFVIIISAIPNQRINEWLELLFPHYWLRIDMGDLQLAAILVDI